MKLFETFRRDWAEAEAYVAAKTEMWLHEESGERAFRTATLEAQSTLESWCTHGGFLPRRHSRLAYVLRFLLMWDNALRPTAWWDRRQALQRRKEDARCQQSSWID